MGRCSVRPPTALPPTITARCRISVRFVASRLVHTGSPASPIDGRVIGSPSGGDEDVVCVDLAIGDGDSARAGERGAALDDGDALVLVAGHWGGVVEVTEQVVAVIAQIGPVQVRGGNTLGAVRLGGGPPAPAAASWMGRRPSRRIHRRSGTTVGRSAAGW